MIKFLNAIFFTIFITSCATNQTMISQTQDKHGSAPHTIKGLIVSCVDYRLVSDDLPEFTKTLGLVENADLITIPGASLGAVLNDKHPAIKNAKQNLGTALPAHKHHMHDLGEAFDITYQFLQKVHGFTDIYVIDHRDCGMYKAAYAKSYASERDAETAQHVENMIKFKTKIDASGLNLKVRFFLMDIVPFGHPVSVEEISWNDKTITVLKNGKSKILPRSTK